MRVSRRFRAAQGSIGDSSKRGQPRRRKRAGARRAGLIAVVAVVGWYVFALAVLAPLTDAPVADSWLYGAATRRFLHTGEIRFAGYTQALAVAQVVYGAAWGRIFGANAVSLEMSDVMLAVACCVMFHALLKRCGARDWQALAATGLLACNPCFTFLSFSFMTEIPFLTMLIAAHLAFACADGERLNRWLWLAGAFAVIDFLVRPFGGMAIAGCVGAIVLYNSRLLAALGTPRRTHALQTAQLVRILAPFAAALLACALIWIWLTVLGPKPWDLQRDENHFAWLLLVPFANYLRAGVLGPLLYLGAVLAPMALLQLATPRWRFVAGWGGAILASTLLLMRLDHRLPVSPEFSCFGGWHNVLLLRGMSNRFFWESGWQYGFLVLGSFGAAGLIAAFADVYPRMRRAAAAVLIGAMVYWAATLPLWFYNDRYYLVLVPAGATVLALSRLPRSRMVVSAAFAMTLAMGLMALGGTYSYQRGLEVLVTARNTLEREGVPRSAIDAGYSLNGEDLYRYPKHGIETLKLEAGIPMITSRKIDDYTLASEPLPGTEVVKRIRWPGPFGFGHRYIYLVKKSATQAGEVGKVQPDSMRPAH
ncbi:MAG TPA: glycosyltransferase family 39 protein [Candidatus Acidoferrales bacterium]|nr:glycosyltransferase family 39 protein [Candidatus Acidoferrales bacterium]